MFIDNYSTNVISWDEFEWVDFVVNDRVSFKSLFQMHNEHRTFFPKIIYYTIAKITSMNSVAQMYVNTLPIILLYAALSSYINRILVANRIAAYVSIFTIGLLLFCPVQYDNFLWGFQIGFTMVYGFSVLALLFVSLSICEERKNEQNFYLGIICAVIASFSSAQGLMVWPCMLIIWVLFSRKEIFKNKKCILWIFLSVLVWFVYISGVKSLGGNVDINHIAVNLKDYFKYFFALLGSCLVRHVTAAIFLGVAATLISILIAVDFLISRPKYGTLSAAMVLFGLMVSASVTLGRVDIGFIQSTSSRYTTFTLCVYIGIFLYALQKICLASKTKSGSNTIGGFIPFINRKITIWCLLATPILLYVSYFQSVNEVIPYKEFNVLRKFVLVSYEHQTDKNLQTLFLDAGLVREGAGLLQSRKYNAFIDSDDYIMPEALYIDSNAIQDYSQSATYIDINSVFIDYDEATPYLSVCSWAVDPNNGDCADSVFICFNDKPFRAFYGLDRDDVAVHFNNPKYKSSGFEFDIPIGEFIDGTYNMSLKILSKDKIHYYNIATDIYISISGNQAWIETQDLAA